MSPPASTCTQLQRAGRCQLLVDIREHRKGGRPEAWLFCFWKACSLLQQSRGNNQKFICFAIQLPASVPRLNFHVTPFAV